MMYNPSRALLPPMPISARTLATGVLRYHQSTIMRWNRTRSQSNGYWRRTNESSYSILHPSYVYYSSGLLLISSPCVLGHLMRKNTYVKLCVSRQRLPLMNINVCWASHTQKTTSLNINCCLPLTSQLLQLLEKRRAFFWIRDDLMFL